MKEQTVRLGPREQQIVELLLQGCDNAEIARQLQMARRTVKAHFNRLFLRFGITGGIKRVKLATLLYRRQACQMSVMEVVSPVNVSSESSSLWPKARRNSTNWAPQSTGNRTPGGCGAFLLHQQHLFVRPRPVADEPDRSSWPLHFREDRGLRARGLPWNSASPPTAITTSQPRRCLALYHACRSDRSQQYSAPRIRFP